MVFVIGMLSLLALGSAAWTVIQIVKPEAFFKAEEAANLKRVRPKWYLAGGVVGIICIAVLWTQAARLGLRSVWILTAVMTLGALKPLGMVFFYEKFSGGASQVVDAVRGSKSAYLAMTASRGVLSLALAAAALYSAGVFGPVR